MNYRLFVRAALLIVLLSALSPAPPARAQAQVSLSATVAFAGNYVPGTWLPITARIENAGAAANVMLAASLPGAAVRHLIPVELAGGAQKQEVLYVAMDQSVREVLVTVEQNGAVLAEQTLELRPRVDERLLGIMAGDDPGLSLPRREELTVFPLTPVRLAPADLPDQVAGLSSLGLLLLHDLPPDSLDEAQLGALLAWVRMGGHLLIGGGPAASPVSAWLPEDLQAATVGGPATIDDRPLAELSVAPGPGSLEGVQLTPLPGGVAAGPAAWPAWVARPFGQGKITQLAFDPGAPALASWAAAPGFWDALLQPALAVSTIFGRQSSVDLIQEQLLAGTLTALPSVEQPPVDMLFLLLVVYTIVIGPLLALFLRRIDRQSWSWLLVPVIAVSSGLLLLTLALGMRASDMVINQISLVEDLGNGQARARTLVGFLAPQAASFSAQLPPGTITRAVRDISGIYGDVGGVSGDLLQGSDQITVAVEPWLLQGLFVEQQLPLEGLAAQITVDDQGTQIEVSNRSDRPLRDVVAVYGSRVLHLGDIRPGEQLRGRWSPSQEIATSSDAIVGQIFAAEVAAANRPGQAANRRTEMRIAMANAAIYRGVNESVSGPLVLAWVDQSPLEAVIAAPRAAQQRQTLLTMRPQVRASGPVSLPTGWLLPDPALSQRDTCTSSGITGLRANPGPATIVMRLPDDLSPLQPVEITLTLDSSERWPGAGLTTELYDWEQATWVDQSFDGPGDLELSEPGRYLSAGRLQIRLSGAVERAGCLLVTARVQGVLP